ncbi:restriction endonuclease subunit S [Glaesserella parasuis]|nr:restriction endonuclease subunit S [Glaesserella parasuis]
MSSLKCRLGDIAHIVMGQSPSGDEVNAQYLGIPLLNGPSEFTEFYPIPVQYTECGRKFAEQGDLLFCVRGSTTGKMNIADQKYAIGRGLAAISGKNGYSTEYIKIILEQNLEKILRSATGSTFPNVGRDLLCNLEVAINSVDVAENISQISATINKKIQLNTQINQTLEQIAQTIFKSWFIDFDPVHAKANALASGQTTEQATQAAMAVISGKNTQELHRLQTANPEQYQQLWEIAEAFPSGVDEEGVPRGWEERELSSLFEFLSGAQPPKSEHIYEEKEGYERFIQNRDYSNDNHKTYIPISKKNKRCTEKDILMDKYGEAGKVRYGIKGAYNVALAKIVPQKDNLREFLRSYFTQDKIRNYLSSSSMASTRNSLNSTTFTGMKVIVPNDFLLSTFDKLANEKIDKILQIKQENIELSKLRDYLLPKLLSGEV